MPVAPEIFFAYADQLQARKLEASRQAFRLQVQLYREADGSAEAAYLQRKIDELRAAERLMDKKLACLAFAM